MINYIYLCTYVHTCYYSERYIADIRGCCSNPVVSGIAFSCTSDSKLTSQCISTMMSDIVDISPIMIYQFCCTCILNESIPLYITTIYSCVQHTSKHCLSSFTYNDIIWLTNYCSRKQSRTLSQPSWGQLI